MAIFYIICLILLLQFIKRVNKFGNLFTLLFTLPNAESKLVSKASLQNAPDLFNIHLMNKNCSYLKKYRRFAKIGHGINNCCCFYSFYNYSLQLHP